MAYETFEPGDTRQFTWTSSVAPDAAPVFKLWRAEAIRSYTIVNCITAETSDTMHYYVMQTMPATEGEYRGEWFAQKTAASSVRNKIDRFGFLVFESKMHA